MASVELKAGDLAAVVGDNSSNGEHRAGYNGVWRLRHSSQPRSLFVPAYAGLNLEHIFDGQTDDNEPAVFFEPRHAPMRLTRISDSEAELHQPPTPVFHLESRTRFTLRPPHYLDFEFRCTPRQHVFRQGWIGLFWASYIDGPDDKSMYFVGEEGLWTQLCTQKHGGESTVRHRDDRMALSFRRENRESLFRSLSPLRFDLPLFYGNFENLTWAVMFERPDGIRFAHSPSGGGVNEARRTANPAWDFLWIIPQYEVNRSYTLRGRALLRPHCSRQETLEELRRWRSGQGATVTLNTRGQSNG